MADYINYPDPLTQKPFTVNPLNMPNRTDLASRGNTLEVNAGRGVQYVVCNRATRLISGLLARATGASVDDIHQELVSSIVGNARMVPAGVLITTRSQEYGYTLLVAG